MTLRGKAAIVGIGEVPTRRLLEGRTLYGLCAEAAGYAIQGRGSAKAGHKRPGYGRGRRARDGGGVYRHQAYVRHGRLDAGGERGVGDYGRRQRYQCRVCAIRFLVVMGNSRSSRAVPGGASVRSEWEEPYGMAPGAGTGYALIYNRHMYEYGTTQEQMAKVAADQRFNALENENAVFHGQPASAQDILNSRYVNYPLRLLGVRYALRRGGGADNDDAGAGQGAAESSGVPAGVGHGAVERERVAE